MLARSLLEDQVSAPTVGSWVWLPHQRMSMKALLLREECGCVARRRMMNAVRSCGAGERPDSGGVGAPLSPPMGPLNVFSPV